MKYKVIPYNTVEYASSASFPVSGETGKFYLDLTQMRLYSWSGTAYIPASFRYIGAPTYHGSYLQPGYLELSRAASSNPIDWHVGDYIRYDRTGRIYRLYDTPQVERLASTGNYGESFSYRNVNFYDDVKQIESCPFRDLVEGNNGYHYSSHQEVGFAGNVQNVADRIQVNLDNHFGSGNWVIGVSDDIPDTYEIETIRSVVVSGTCLDALNAIYEVWPKLGWTFSVENGMNTITIGLPNVDLEYSGLATNQFSYNNGLTALKRNVKSAETFCTRMYVYGTERNLINRYYNGKDIYNAGSVYIPNLMIPLRFWGTTSSKPDAAKAYLENPNAVAKYGLIVRDVYFDGTNGRPEVYPSVEDRDIANLKAAKESLNKTGAGAPDYYPQTEDDTLRLDRIKAAVSMPSDDGSLDNDNGSKYSEQDTYTIPASIDSATLASHAIRICRLTLHTFTQTGAIEVSLNGNIIITTASAVSETFACIAIYRGGSPTRSAVLAKADLTLTGVSGNVYTYSLGKIIRTGSVDSPITGEISIALEYGFVNDEHPETTVVTTATTTNASLLTGIVKILAPSFKVRLQQIGFDIRNQAAEGATLSMKSGMCAGREFEITNTEYDSSDDSWILTCNRAKDESTSMAYPNSTFVIAENDEFVLTGITMPEEYVLISAERLYSLGSRLFEEVLNFLPSYEPTIDSKKVYENIKAHPSDGQYKLLEGKYMRLYDVDLFPDGNHEAVSMIVSVTINENESSIPTYRVTLADEVNMPGSISRTLGQLASQVHTLANQPKYGNGNYYNSTPDGGSPTLPVYIKGDLPRPVEGIDVPENVRSSKNVEAGVDVHAYGKVISENLALMKKGVQFGEFTPGLLGQGGKIDQQGFGEMRGLKLWEWLEVPELRYNRISIYTGIRWDTFGGGIIETITPDETLGTGSGTLKLEEGEIGAIAVGDLCMGIWHDRTGNAASNTDDHQGNFTFAGFKTVYFQITGVSGSNNENFTYILRSNAQGGNGVHPFAMMHFAGRGNISNTARQSFIYTTTEYSLALTGVSTWNFQSSNYYQIVGNLEGFSMPAIDRLGNPYTKYFHGYGQVFGNAYIFGQIDQFERIGYRASVDQSKGGSLAPGETEYVTVTVWNGYGEDVTSQFTHLAVTRNTGDQASDAVWNAQHTSVNNPFPIAFTDLGIDGIHQLMAVFTVIASDEVNGIEAQQATVDYFS